MLRYTFSEARNLEIISMSHVLVKRDELILNIVGSRRNSKDTLDLLRHLREGSFEAQGLIPQFFMLPIASVLSTFPVVHVKVSVDFYVIF